MAETLIRHAHQSKPLLEAEVLDKGFADSAHVLALDLDVHWPSWLSLLQLDQEYIVILRREPDANVVRAEETLGFARELLRFL